MTDTPLTTTRKARYGVTRRTHISITYTAHDQIQAWNRWLCWDTAVCLLPVMNWLK